MVRPGDKRDCWWRLVASDRYMETVSRADVDGLLGLSSWKGRVTITRDKRSWLAESEILGTDSKYSKKILLHSLGFPLGGVAEVTPCSGDITQMGICLADVYISADTAQSMLCVICGYILYLRSYCPLCMLLNSHYHHILGLATGVKDVRWLRSLPILLGYILSTVYQPM